MITYYLNLFLILLLSALILLQDYKDRKVHLFNLLGFAFAAASFQTQQNIFLKIFFIESLLNLLLLLIMLLSIYIYFKWIRKINPRTTIGIGDLILFIAYVTGYNTLEFIIHFTAALVASLCLHLLLKKSYKNYDTVPLAGYMAIYLSLQKLLHEFTSLVP